MRIKILMLLLLISVNNCFAQKPAIVLNQVGFFPAASKIAVVINSPASQYFYILSANKKDTLYNGKLQTPVQSAYSSIITRIADFSNFKQSGSFIIAVKDMPLFALFSISQNVLHDVSVASLKAFYYQRSDMPLEEKYAGQWKRAAGHPDTNVFIHPSAATNKKPAGTIISSAAGWYDAGDYNKYIVNSGITVSTLLSAYEDFSNYFKQLQTNIPESDNQIPDILDETLYNLRWMLTMQDKDDGGVYHKCTNAAFDGMVMPGVTKLPRYVVQKSTAATLDFAAVMAQAARIFKKFQSVYPGLSDSCMNAALSAWQWAVNNPAVMYNQEEMNKNFSPAVSTGAYGDRNVSDEWFWAAAALTAATGNTQYINHKNVQTNWQMDIPTWGKVSMLGVYTILKNKKVFAKTNIDIKKLQNDFIAFANQLTGGGNAAFKTVMGQSAKDFVWGSNAVAMNQSMLLLKAYLITNDKKYIEAAASNFDYVLGRNATGYCFITGIGYTSPMHIHHRPSQADGIVAPVPGLLAGGANPGRQDKCNYPFTEIETSYTDEACSYASNEIAINWNAPLVYVSGGINSLR
jgi:endoglucanase